MADQYDVLILGSGQAGNPLSSEFVKAGKRVALIERAEVAGTCINYGCTPTKTMVASAQRAWQARHAAELGIELGAVRVNLEQVRARKRKIVEQFRRSNEARFASGQPELVRGEARFVAPKEIAVALKSGGERRMTAETIVINTGDHPTVPKLEGLSDVPFLDNVSLMELGAVPEHLLILGGGYEAVEFGQMFRRFGSEVSLIERGKHVLGREDADISEAIEAILREDGLTIETGAQAVRVEGSQGADNCPSGGREEHLRLASFRWGGPLPKYEGAQSRSRRRSDRWQGLHNRWMRSCARMCRVSTLWAM